MNTHTHKTTETKSNAAANSITVQRSAGKKIFQSEDSRPELAAQRQMQEAANNSKQVKQLKAVQHMADNSKKTKAGNHLSVEVAQLEDIEMEEIRARVATCVTNGVVHDIGKSFASVSSKAIHLQETDRVIYEIAWDAAVAPVGHEGMHAVANTASDFIVDRSQEGEAIGNPRAHYRRDGANGFVFEFRDGIEWPTELNGGSWRFRLRVVNGAGTEVARSATAIVNWTH